MASLTICQRLADWSTNAVAIGLTATQVTSLTTLVTAARNA